MKESVLTAKIAAALRARGAWVYKTVGGPYARAGVPDLIICYRGMFLALEVKTPRTVRKVSKLQELELRRIIQAGGVARVVSSVAEAISVISTYDDRPWWG